MVFLINLTSPHLFPVTSCWDGAGVKCALLNMFQGTNAASVRYICTACSLFVCAQVGLCMCVFVFLTVNGDGCGGKGGAITLGLQMGFPEEGHAPVFSETATKANMAADPFLHLKGSADTSIAREQ